MLIYQKLSIFTELSDKINFKTFVCTRIFFEIPNTYNKRIVKNNIFISIFNLKLRRKYECLKA